MPKKVLLLDDEDEPFDLSMDKSLDFDDVNDFQVNASFAQKYEFEKQREERTNLAAKYADYSEDESSGSEVEDEDGVLVTADVDAQILKTISAIREKSSVVYDESVTFFKEPELDVQTILKKDKVVGVSLADYQRNALLNGVSEEPIYAPTHTQEQERLRSEFKAAIEEDNVEDDDVFTFKKTEPVDSEDYGTFLLKQMGSEVKDIKEWDDTKKSMDPKEVFLMDFVLKRGWIDKMDSGKSEAREVKSQRESAFEHHPHPEIDDSEDEEAFDAAEEFERKYNFRFEEDGGDHIMTYSRNVDGLLRREDTTRKEKRADIKKRKDALKKQKEEEIKRLKNLKKQELVEKLKRISDMAGGELQGIQEADLEKDFDPNDYDETMQRAFNDAYYVSSDPLKKPVFDDDIDVSEYMQEAPQGTFAAAVANEDDFMMDADYMPGGEYYEKPETKTDDKKKKKSKKDKEEPEVDLGQYLDELYKLDYEDIIGDLPTRFKYQQVETQDFGLTAEEILKAQDTDLNQLISLKKLAPYRRPEVVEKDMEKYKKSKKKRLREFRTLIGTKKAPEVPEDSKKAKKEKYKKRALEQAAEPQEYFIQKKLKKAGITSERLDAYSASSTKKKSKK